MRPPELRAYWFSRPFSCAFSCVVPRTSWCSSGAASNSAGSAAAVRCADFARRLFTLLIAASRGLRPPKGRLVGFEGCSSGRLAIAVVARAGESSRVEREPASGPLRRGDEFRLLTVSAP